MLKISPYYLELYTKIITCKLCLSFLVWDCLFFIFSKIIWVRVDRNVDMVKLMVSWVMITRGWWLIYFSLLWCVLNILHNRRKIRRKRSRRIERGRRRKKGSMRRQKYLWRNRVGVRHTSNTIKPYFMSRLF